MHGFAKKSGLGNLAGLVLGDGAGNFISAPGAGVSRNLAHQSLANNTFVDIQWDTTDWDDLGFFDSGTSTTNLTIPTGQNGRYMIVAGCFFNTNATGRRILSIRVNGSQVASTRQLVVDGSTGCALIAARMFVLSVGDNVTAAAFQTSGGALDLFALGAPNFNFLNIQRIN